MIIIVCRDIFPLRQSVLGFLSVLAFFSHLACLSYLAKENICRYTVIIIYEIQTIRNCEAAGRSLGITRAPFRARENIFVRGWVLEGVDVSEQFCQFLFCILRCFCHLRRVILLQGHSKCLFSTLKLSKRSWSPQPNRQEVI